MTVPPLLKDSDPTPLGWQRKVRDAVNAVLRRTLDSGPSTARPANPTNGQTYYDDTLGRPVWWNSAASRWQGAEGPTEVANPTANYSVGASDGAIINGKTGSSLTLTLPAAADNAGREIMVKTLQAQTVISASSNVAPIGNATLGTAILPATVGAWALLKSNGAAWVIMMRGT